MSKKSPALKWPLLYEIQKTCMHAAILKYYTPPPPPIHHDITFILRTKGEDRYYCNVPRSNVLSQFQFIFVRFSLGLELTVLFPHTYAKRTHTQRKR